MKLTSRFPSLGIIGGMGHVSTIDYYSRVIKLFQARKAAVRNDDYPRVCIQGIADADNVETLDEGNLAVQLTKASELLKESGVDVIGVPCNTVHSLMPSIADRVRVPFLDMTAATIRQIESEDPAHCMILATRRTIAKGIYRPRSRMERTKWLEPNPEQQEKIDSIILRVNAGDSIDELTPEIELIATRLPRDAAILLACTELSGFAPYLRSQGKKIIDSLEELVIVTFAAVSREHGRDN